MSEMDDVLKEFLVESFENLDRLDQDLLALERDPSDRELVGRIFRTVHTVKGACGFLGFKKLETVAHVAENLLSRLRDGVLRFTPDVADALLASGDAIRSMLRLIERDGDDGPEDYATLRERLGALASGRPDVPEPAETPEGAAAAPPLEPSPIELRSTPPPAAAPSSASSDAARGADDARPEDAAASGVADDTIRVDVALLDKLMNLVGELVLARNQVLQHVQARGDVALGSASQRLNHITSELQEGVMKTRMQPIGNLWNKFPRLVRDVAASLGKRIRVEMEGQDVEVDRSILEAVKDPLTHVIRNACDHGIETPEARLAAGKPAEGRVRLAAYHEGGQVILEISDDGGGVRPDRIRARALERGVITPAQAERMTPREVQNLVFLPGFSTAEAVTKVSGRGVGMDVVKTNVERIGGAVDLASEPGEGATLRIRIPLTLAIVPALTVRCGADRYAIPQVSLLELVRLDSEHGVESFHGAPVYRLRGKLLPLVRLADLVGRTGAAPATSAGPDADAEHIVVLQADDRIFGLVVDGVCDTGEIVVKPLAKRLKKIGLYAGATIMGDGGVTLILDVAGLAHAGRIAVARRRDVLRDADSDSDSGTITPRPSSDRGPRAWLVAASGGRRYAIPLESVTRLEEFKPSAFERAAGIEVAQYRGDLLPVVRLCTFFGEACPTASEVDARGGVPVIVCGDGDRVAGVVVEEVVDVVEEAVTVRRDVRGRGLAGVAVIQGRTVDVLDLQALVEEGLRTAPRR